MQQRRYSGSGSGSGLVWTKSWYRGIVIGRYRSGVWMRSVNKSPLNYCTAAAVEAVVEARERVGVRYSTTPYGIFY